MARGQMTKRPQGRAQFPKTQGTNDKTCPKQGATSKLLENGFYQTEYSPIQEYHN